MAIDFKALNEAVDIKDVADLIGLRVDRRSFCLCPFHGDKNPSMVVKGHRYRCFACGANGDSIDLYANYCNTDMITSAKEVAKIVGGIQQYTYEDRNIVEDAKDNLTKEELDLIIGKIKLPMSMAKKTIVAKSEIAIEPEGRKNGGEFFDGEYLLFKTTKSSTLADVKTREFDIYKDFLLRLAERKKYVFDQLSKRVKNVNRQELSDKDRNILSDVYARRAEECERILNKIKKFSASKLRKG